jgi:hypothetical protein
MADLRTIIENEWWIVCGLLPADRFVTFCRDRGIDTSKDQLERLETLGLLSPLARVEFPKIIVKVEYAQDRKSCQDLGILADGEVWLGETEEEYSSFEFTRSFAEDWLEHGHLWDPSSRVFEPWSTFFTEGRRVESYYSMFQCLPLYGLQQSLGMRIRAEHWGTCDPRETARHGTGLTEWAASVIQAMQSSGRPTDKVAAICQAISNRYYPSTQSDRRTVVVSRSGPYYNWDWGRYRDNWDPEAVRGLLGIVPGEVRALQQLTAGNAKHVDPLASWYELVRFISVDQRARLKGMALLAQTLYSMEEMLRLFYRDLTGEKLPGPGEGWGRRRAGLYGEGVPENELQFLEFLTNQYHLNPRPRLILLVEGESERQEVPRIARELYGMPLERGGIRVEELGGIGGASKLERFIDHYHYLQTVVYVILDNDKDGKRLRRGLLNARSKYPGIKGGVTKPDLVFLWEKSFEFDNFSDEDLARAMTEVAGGRHEFSPDEVRVARENFGKGKDTLSDLYERRLSYALNKVELACALVTRILANPESEFDQAGQPRRPIVMKIRELIQLAARNYQPVRLTDWERTQRGEFLRGQAGLGSGS